MIRMKSFWKIEYNRIIRSVGFYFAIIIGMVLVILQLWQEQIPNYQAVEAVKEWEWTGKKVAPINCFEIWMGGEMHSMASFLFFLILPLISVLPYASTFFEDCKSGLIKNIYYRTERKAYLRSRFVMVFLSSAVVIWIPLLISFIFAAILFPAVIPQPQDVFVTVSATSMLYQLFYTKPICYCLCYIFLDGLAAGCWGGFALMVSYFAEYKFIVMLAPFALHLFVYSFLNLFNLASYSPVYFFQSSMSYTYWWQFLLFFICIGLIPYGIYRYMGEKKDVF